MQSPLLGFNNNVKHRGRLFHIQTEDSGVRHPHVITHLFMDGGRILKTVKTSYAQHVGSEKLTEVVRDLMKEQHKMMFIALRDGQFDYVLDPDEPAPVSRAGGNSTSRATFQPTPTPPAAADAPGLAKGASATAQAKPAKESAASGVRSNQRREAPEFFAAPASDAAKVDVVPPEDPARPAQKTPTAAPPTKKEPRDRQSSGRYVASRPAAIFTSGRAPEAGGSIFGDDLISEKSLDEVILSYLSEDLEGASTKK
jgi:hypothetical protein